MLRPLLIGALAFCMLARPASAQTIVYDNGPSVDGYGVLIGGAEWAFSADVTFDKSTQFDGVRFWNYQYGLGPATNWYWYIRDAAFSVLASGKTTGLHTPVASLCCGALRYLNELSIQPIVLNAGQYWLTLAAPESPQYVWWDRASPNGTLPNRMNTYYSVPYDQEVAFQLTQTNVVPEPSSFALVCAGVMLVGILARRRGAPASHRRS